ncbi:hypothetical protein D3C86_2195730 [compost metagenome]
MKYWPAEPLLGPPGLRLTVRTHLTFSGSPSTGRGNRSGHSQTPPVAFAGPKVLSGSQVFRSRDL